MRVLWVRNEITKPKGGEKKGKKKKKRITFFLFFYILICSLGKQGLGASGRYDGVMSEKRNTFRDAD